MEQLDPQFEPLLRGHPMAQLRAHAGAIYGAWPDLRLAYLSPGWFRFAQDNGGTAVLEGEWSLGRSILDGISGPIRRFYELNLEACLRSGEPWSHEYECSSETLYRRFRQTAYPLGRQEGLLIANAIVVERPHDEGRHGQPPDPGLYRGEHGIVTQCAHCRTVRHPAEPGRWDWVPEWVRQSPPRTSHGLCAVCAGIYFSAD